MGKGTDSFYNGRKNKRAEIWLLLRPIPRDDIRNISAIAKKLRRSVVIARGALCVCYSCCSHGEDIRMWALHSTTSAGLPPYRHTTALDL